MTIHVTPIESAPVSHHHDFKYSHHVRVFQMYAFHGRPDVIVPQDTYWTGKSYASEAALRRDLADKSFPDTLVKDLEKEALEMHFKGFKVVKTVVAFGSPWKEGYAVDSFDARHLKRAYAHHKASPKPNVGSKPHLAWNVTKQEDWGQKMDAAFIDHIQYLRPRTRHLEGIAHFSSESKIVAEFEKAAPVWLVKGKAYERIGDFFLTLMERKKYDAHRECLDVWGSLILHRPEALYSHFRVGITHSQNLIRGDINPVIQCTDEFETINTLLAMFPDTCLAGDQLLSSSWLNGIKYPEFRDAGMIALMAGYARYQKKVYHYEYCKAQRAGLPIVTEESICSEYFRKVAASAGVELNKLLSYMGDFPEGGSKAVNKFFSDLTKGANEGMGYNKYPQPIGYTASKEMSLRLVPEPLDVMLKAKLMAHPDESGHHVSKVAQDQDRLYFTRLIHHPLITVDQLKNMMPYDRFVRADIDEMTRRDPALAQAYINDMSDEEMGAQIAKNNVPRQYINKSSHRDKLISVDLGL